ncbi:MULTISPECIES: hypothetical protein [Chryseobacterium]|uniref:hypothetical protein n=1 Tax=Chryseobacterium TaxID=59732 RepID=UPI0012961432|nr:MULTISPECIES: hypothetical protein [Chryseobacterium]MDR6923706.1 hypothetical protein [Chryseobacterium sp. 2987]
MTMFTIPEVSEAEADILKEKRNPQNFPKTITFPFSEQYKNLVTPIRTIEIASETILYNAVEAVSENKESEWKDYWCFAGNGQGDRWFLNKENSIFFYDHDASDELLPMEINFGQWLQMAYIIHQLDDCYDEYEIIPQLIKETFYKTLNNIGPGLGERYPFTV